MHNFASSVRSVLRTRILLSVHVASLSESRRRIDRPASADDGYPARMKSSVLTPSVPVSHAEAIVIYALPCALRSTADTSDFRQESDRGNIR